MTDRSVPAAPGGFVGRDAELSVLRDLVADAAAGRGGSVLVEGEAGIGKSAVLAAGLSGAAELGCQVLWCTADASRERLPLGVLADGLGLGPQELLPAGLVEGRFSAAVDPVTAMMKALLERIERWCAVTPGVLVLDDLHNADEASLLAWNRLSRSLAQLPVLLAAAARPVPERVELARLRRALLANGTVPLSLGPLPEPQVVGLVAGLVGAGVGPGLRRLAAEAGGNPLFVREVVEAQRQEGRILVERGVADLAGGDAAVAPPVSLAAAIESRLGSLPPRAVSLLRWAAVLGAEFAVVDLATVAGLRATEVVALAEQAVADGVLVESGLRLAFRHPLFQQALAHAGPVGEREGSYRRAARSLAEAGAPVERVAQLLLAAASPAEDWVPDWLCAGVDSLAVRAPEVAAELTGRVLDELADDDPRRERLGATLVTVLRLLARYDEVDRVAGALLAQASDPGCAGRTAWALAYALLGRGKRAQALELVEDTLRRWPTVVPWAARLRALWGVLIVDEHQQFDVARDTAEEVIAEGEQTGDRFAVGFGLHVLSMVAEADTKLAYVDRALTVVADHLDGADLRLLLSSNKAGVLMSLGRTDEAEHTIREALTLAEQTGTPRMLTLRSRAAKIYYSLGRWDDALVELEIAAELLEDRPVTAYAAVDVHSLAALIAAHRDDRAGMERHLSMVDNVPPACHGTDVSPFTRALVAEREGRFSVALELLAAQVRATEDDPREIHGDRLPVVVRLALATGHRELARWATGLSEREARAESGPSTHAAARRCHGLLDAKVVDVRAAVDAYRGIGEVPALAGSLEDLAVVYGQRGEVQEGRAAYAEAVEIYQGLGAATDLARARSRVRPYGISAGPRGGPTRPVSGWYALTTTERKIAALVAEGLSNPDIASRLFLSRRTVQSHVSHILTKLGARSRVDIAREAALHPA